MPVYQKYTYGSGENFRIIGSPLSILAILFLSLSCSLSGQSQLHRHSSSNEIAIITGAVFDLGENNFAYSIHGHYLFSPAEVAEGISLGASAEYVFGDEPHLTVGPAVSVNPWSNLIILYSIGITFAGFDESQVREHYFSNHIELALEFGIGDHFHLGPTIGFNLSGYDNHIAAGLHTGISF